MGQQRMEETLVKLGSPCFAKSKSDILYWAGRKGGREAGVKDDTAHFCQLDLALEPPVCNPYSDLKVSIF